MVTVSTDEDEAELRRFVSALALTLPVLRDPGGRVAAGEYRTTGYPETFVLDREGRILQHVVGPAEWDSPERLAELRRLLESAPAPTMLTPATRACTECMGMQALRACARHRDSSAHS